MSSAFVLVTGITCGILFVLAGDDSDASLAEYVIFVWLAAFSLVTVGFLGDIRQRLQRLEERLQKPESSDQIAA